MELSNLTGKYFFVKLFEIDPDKTSEQFLPSEIKIIRTKIKGDKATITIRTKDKGEEFIPMVKEDGRWKIDISEKLNQVEK
jgi:hypothetical protein